MICPIIKLMKGRKKPVYQKHPWIFSKALLNPDKNLSPGTLVDVLAFDGSFLVKAYYNPKSQITLRILSTSKSTEINTDFFRQRIKTALDRRKSLLKSKNTNAFRAVHAESDLLPGLIIDKYDHTVVFQCQTAGMDKQRDKIV